MSLNQLFRTACGLSLWIGIHVASVSPGFAQIEPPPGSGAPSGTVGGGSRS